jgi:tetratricopeptide (TPR) repeat protein
MDAQQYYIRGVSAVKQGDMLNGRKLLLQSLKLDQNNDKAWIWVAQTLAESDKKLQCAERALAINPQNADALKLKKSLSQPVKPKSKNTRADQQKIKLLMREAETLIKTNRRPEAVDKWVMVLDIQFDHEEAMRQAVEYFMARDMVEEVEVLLYNAVDMGTENSTLLLSARDLAEQRHDLNRLDALNELIVSKEWISSKRVLRIAEGYIKQDLFDEAIRILRNGLESHPNDSLILNRLAEIHEETGRENLALQYYEQVANQDVRSKLSKKADKRLSESVPVMTDRERGSVWLAWREVWGVFLLFFLFAFQDSGLNFLEMGAGRWMGVLLSLVGTYLLITATSSPQQAPLAKILGGHLPVDSPKSPQRKLNSFASLFTEMGIEVDNESFYTGPIHEPTHLPIIPQWIRLVFGFSGCLMLVFAFYLVLPTALGLLGLPELHLDTEFYSVMGGG